MFKELSDADKRRLLKQLHKLMDELRSSTVFVEGKKDAIALQKLGCGSIMTISGNLRQSCLKAHEMNLKEAIVLTDLDERGQELADEARKELERYGIMAKPEPRIALSRILGILEFETAYKKYKRFLEEINE